MIRINLLATEKRAAKKKAAAAPGALQLYLFLGLFAGGALLSRRDERLAAGASDVTVVLMTPIAGG